MSKSALLKDLAAQLSDALPKHLHGLKNDFNKTCHLILTKTFAKFDLVTREEFDSQTKVLARTRKKLEALEKEVTELEKILSKKSK